MGPFYCPADQRVYLDLSFFDEMAQRFHAPGQFPQAYVIAHEVGHHVQNLLGITGKVEQMRQKMSKRDANAMSVRVELQADCLAGVWAYHANQDRGGKMIDENDVDQALAAATAIGDDRLQTPGAGPRRARQFYPRYQRATRALVQSRPAGRRREELRYLPGSQL